MSQAIVGRHEGYEAPEAIQYAVEEWGKSVGREAHIAFAPYPRGASKAPGCFTVFLERKGNDPIMRLYQEGKVEKKPYEAVPLHEWDSDLGEYIPLRLEEYGPTGVVEILQRGDVWSGRGDYPSLKAAAKASIARMQEAMKKKRQDANESGRETAWLHRRSALGIPYLTVGKDLTEEPSGKEAPGEVAATADIHIVKE